MSETRVADKSDYKLIFQLATSIAIDDADQKKPKKSGNKLWKLIRNLAKTNCDLQEVPRPIERIELRKAYVAAYDIYRRSKKWK